MDEGAQVFAQQAKAAGVTVNVKILDSGAFYGDQYLKWPFSTDFWGSRNYLSQVAAGSLPTSPYNETHWPDSSHQKFLSLYKQALQTVDRHEATRDHPRDAEDGVRHRRLHHLGLQHPARRLHAPR